MTNSRLVIDQHEVCLACSPDGLVSIPGIHESNGLVEIKCPFLAAEKQLTPQEVADVLSSFLCRRSSDASGLELNQKHNYFYQVQGQLAITRRPWCDFVVWTPKGMLVERIRFDPKFWEDIKSKLVRFHREAILPELTLPRHPTGLQSIREPLKETQLTTM